MEDFIQFEVETMQRLNTNRNILREYLERYDFKVILVYLFKHETEKTSNIMKIVTDEPLITNYVTDIYLSTRADSLNEIPSQSTINKIISLIHNIYLHITTTTYLSSPLKELGEEVKIDNLLVERSLYYDIYTDIYAQVFSPISEEFYTFTGFHLELIFHLHRVLLFYMQQKINNFKGGENLSFDFSMIDIIPFFKDEYANEICSLIRHLSISTSDNSDLLPRFDNPVKEKPIIENDNVLFCPNPDNILKYNKEIIENILSKNTVLRNRYLKNKGKAVETMVVNQLSRLMPTASVGKNLKYKIQEILYELDAIFCIDSFVLFVEIKSGNLSPAAREGKTLRLKRDIQNIVLDAHDQCNRVYNYYLANDSVEFFSNIKIYTVSKIEQKNAYMLSITLDNLDIITANIQRVVDKDKPQNVVTMSLYDLSIITDILNNPSEFFLYLDRRQEVIRLGMVNAHDEIDLFSTFISQGLIFDNYKDYDLIDITDFSNSLDIYYINMPNEKKKPKFYVNPFIATIIQELTQLNKHGWLEVAKTLQGFSRKTQQLITNKAILVLQRSKKKGESDFSILPNSNKTGLTFYSCDKLSDTRYKKMQAYIQMKKKEQNMEKWILLINITKSSKIIADFLIG